MRKMIQIIPLITFFLSPSILTGCGDLKAARDILQQRNREQINQRISELKPLLGQYEGLMHDTRSDRQVKFKLNLVLSGTPYEGAGIPEDTITPTIAGSAYVYSLDSYSDTYILVPFTSSDFDSKTGRLSLFSEEKGSTIVIFAAPGAEITQLSGYWTNNNRGHIGDFEIRKIDSFPR